jgi:uncharacterized protein (TIGR00251 family)
MDRQAIRQTSVGVEIDVHVVPRQRQTGIAGTRGDAILIRLAAAPIEGAANDELIAFVAERTGVPRRSVRIVAGGHSRRKRVAIAGLTVEVVRDRLGLSP